MNKVVEKAMSEKVKFSDGGEVSVKERIDEMIEKGCVVYKKDGWSWIEDIEGNNQYRLRNSVWINYFKFAIKNK